MTGLNICTYVNGFSLNTSTLKQSYVWHSTYNQVYKYQAKKYLAIRRKVDLGSNFNFFTRFSIHLGQLQVLDASLPFPTARKIDELRYL